MYTGLRWGNLRESDCLVDPDFDERITLMWIFRKWKGRYGLNCGGSW
jgi:hypothetical protein